MSQSESAARPLPVWALWLLGTWILGAASFYFIRMTALFYRAYEEAIAAFFQ